MFDPFLSTKRCHRQAGHLQVTFPIPIQSTTPAPDKQFRGDIVGVDLFCGAGGMSLGAQQAGIDLIYAVESCPYAALTYNQNFPGVPLQVGDIRDVNCIPPAPSSAKTVIFGGPPCQGFSTSNQRTRSLSNKQNWMFREFVRLVKSWGPDWVVMENVKGMVETAGGTFLSEIASQLQALGYSVSSTVLNASHFGVPQKRSRLFIVGSRDNVPFKFPENNNTPDTPVSDAIGDLPVLAPGASIDVLQYGHSSPSGYAQLLRNGQTEVSGNLVTNNSSRVLSRYPHVPPGGNWENIPPNLLSNYRDYRRCHTGIYRRLDPRKPSVVIGNFRKNMLIHPYEHRGLSIREAARIQSVPDNFRFYGSIGFQQQQVGNMVPPFLAKAVFGAVIQS